jgi:CubicO group peptidase (beta-lactamase class C family)
VTAAPPATASADLATDPAAAAEPLTPFADPGFRPLVEGFRSLFLRRRDGGGALAVYQHGRPVVDVWAGYADAGSDRPWQADTMSLSFSTSKGVASTVVHRLIDRGVLAADEPIATWWPEFAAKGKGGILLSDLMTHRSGLHRVRGVAETPGDLLDHRRMADRLAARAPEPELGRPAYHAMTYGYLVAAVVERATGRSFGEVLHDEVAAPLDLDGLHIGTPAERHQHIAPFFQQLAPLGLDVARIGHHVKRIPRLRPFVDALLPHGFDAFMNTPALWSATMPAVNGVFTARALARLYAPLANGGEVDGQVFLRPDTLHEAGRVRTRGRDAVLGIRMRWRLGYHGAFVASGEQPRMAFGHYGLGGSGAFADPETGLAVAFTTNKLGTATTPMADIRLARLAKVALECARSAQSS